MLEIALKKLFDNIIRKFSLIIFLVTNLSYSNLEYQILPTVRQRVMDFVEQNPAPKTQPWWQRILVWLVVFIGIIFGLELFTLFLYQIKTNFVLAELVGWDWTGIVWIWFPETLLLGLLVIGLAFWAKNFDQLAPVKVANWSFLAVFIVGIFGAFLLTSDSSVVAQSSIYTNWVLADYRIKVRDQYVKVLNERGEFYGAVAEVQRQNNQTIVSIDHGGAVKTFALPQNKSSLIQARDLIWVAYNTENDEKLVTEFRIIK